MSDPTPTPENNFNTKSILNTIKKLLGMEKEYTAFDTDIIAHINTVFSNLSQMGIGPDDGFVIENDTIEWDSYFGPNDRPNLMQQVKSYIYTKVRIMFDPPANGNLLESLNKIAAELEYRLYVEKGGY